MNIEQILKSYGDKLTIGVLGGHSALDVCAGAKKYGFDTVAVCQKGREKTYSHYYKQKDDQGCVGNIILVDKFSDIVKPEVQEELRSLNTIFIHNRYFWVYCDFEEIENDFNVPIFGTREMLKLEERDIEKNQYWLLEQAGIRIPKIVKDHSNSDQAHELIKNHFNNSSTPLIVKVNEATRTYERAFFVTTSFDHYKATSDELISQNKITEEGLKEATIEEFIIGAQVNFNFFYSPITDALELMGTDTRRQTSLDGFLRLDAKTQTELLNAGYKPSMVENGHMTCTVKESILEKAFEAGEKFVAATKKHASPGIIGPFALQGAVAPFDGKEEIVIFDVSMRIPGSPGTAYTPYTKYLHGRDVTYGERIAMEIQNAQQEGHLNKILT